jgi:signal transduction histidine kinase
MIRVRMIYNKILTGKQGFHLALLSVITIAAFVANIAGILLGLSVITPLLFYLPIIIAAFWFPKRGVLFAVVVGILQVGLVYTYASQTIPDLTYAVTTASFYILVAIAVVISSLSGDVKDKEARYHGIFDHSETGFFLVRNSSENFIIEEVNRRGADMVRQIPDDLVGKSLADLWADIPAREYLLSQLSSNTPVINSESVIGGPENRKIPVLISASRLPGAHTILTLTDISERKIHEEEIKAKNRQLQTINEIIGCATSASTVKDLFCTTMMKTMEFLSFESAGIYINSKEPARMEEYYQIDSASLFSRITHDSGEQSAGWNRAIHQYELYIPTNTDDLPFRYSGIVVPLVTDSYRIGVMYFATERVLDFNPEDVRVLESIGKEIGTAIVKLHLSEELVDANQTANLYLDILMHDINNANLASLWYGDLLTEMVEGEARNISVKMIEGIQKSREIIRNLETIRKIQERKNELKEVDLDRVIRSEINHFPDADIEYEGDSSTVYGDDLLGEIFTNLIGNSLKFGGPATHIKIMATEKTDEGSVLVQVEDNGPGIPDELKKVIFYRFQRNHITSSGKGLGLYIVKTLIERYGGEIWVEDSHQGIHEQGVRFSFTLKKST